MSSVLPVVFHAANPWVALGLTILGAIIDNAIISALTPTQTIETGKMSDIDYQAATYGSQIKKGYGTAKITGNIIWGTKFTEHVHTESSGGKGGGGGTETKSYSYTASFAILISEGPISGIGKVWADGNEFDLSNANYNLYYGTEDQAPDDFMQGIEGAGKVPAYRGLAYIVFKNFNITDFGNRIPSFSFVVAFPKNSVKEIVSDICLDTGLVETLDFNAEALDGLTVDGFTRTGGTTAKDQINDLRLCFVFDGAERRGVIEFLKRDFSNVIPLSSSDYGAFENDPDDEPINTTEAHDLSLPRVLNLGYVAKDNDYQAGTTAAKRQLTSAVDETSVSTNVVLSDSAAKEIAELRFYETWMARTTHETKVAMDFGWLLPLDILEVQLPDGHRQLMMVKSTNFGRPGLNVVKAVNVFSGNYTIATRSVDATPTPIVTIPTDLFYAILDLPKLPPDTISSNDYVYFVSGAVNYLGANVFRSDDDGANYYLKLQNMRDGIIGTASTILADSKTYSWDEANTVDVVIPYGTLASHTKLEVLNYANVAAIGSEIIQYHYATLIADNTYRLSGLLRGRFGTEQYTATHAAGEKFVVLNEATINAIPVAKDDWYKTIPYKIGPRPLSILNAKYQLEQFASQGIMYKPWAGCHLKVEQTGTTYALSWIRRTRKDGAWKDYADAPLNESYEAYDVEAVDSSGNVLGTMTVNTPAATYTGTNVAGFNIYQISDVRGRGWPLKWRCA